MPGFCYNNIIIIFVLSIGTPRNTVKFMTSSYWIKYFLDVTFLSLEILNFEGFKF